MECFSSQADGTLTVIKENTPTSFSVEQTVKTMPGTKRLSLDTKTGRIYMIAAEFGPPATGDARNPDKTSQGNMIPESFTVIVVGK
jgi:hypothetical protein